jgi:hypothetical protein
LAADGAGDGAGGGVDGFGVAEGAGAEAAGAVGVVKGRFSAASRRWAISSS